MIAIGKFEAELNEIEKLLRKYNVHEERNLMPNKDFDPAEYRNKNFTENWKTIITNNIYNFLLSDNSILKFKISDKKASYLFYECPYHCLSYIDFLKENSIDEDDLQKTFYNEYEIYLDQCTQKPSPITVRYDLDIESYNHGLHPVSHIHIGNHNQIRIGINKIINPKTFVSFILRQHYTGLWNDILFGDDEIWRKYFLKEKDVLIKIEKKYWNEFDDAELYLT